MIVLTSMLLSLTVNVTGHTVVHQGVHVEGFD